MGDARDCWVGALLIKPVSLQFDAICVVDWASVRRNIAHSVSGDYLIDGVASKPREDVGDGDFEAFDVFDFDRVLHKRCDPPGDLRAAFRLVHNKATKTPCGQCEG